MQTIIAERDMLDLIPLRPSKTEARRISGGLGIETPLQHVPFVGYLGCAECLAALHQGIIILPMSFGFRRSLACVNHPLWSPVDQRVATGEHFAASSRSPV
ncbi:uncharacterized protein L3040_005784 [Drepanopeziza brunnea f. sp. 'multigermtubi']|uniref:uncharacterized protein n=1 Tax=Drepanopeziza brunnea f. sp. 'multigermtubi' TaxID=698441 RepID=UPI00239AFBC3|nr:hypothetical protein L3040_005784 [Drepanopeziza brunnea f. sp. 'multigermtubi']